MAIVVSAPPAAAADESFYGIVHAPTFDVPLLKGCWYYPFDWTVHLPESSSGMLLSGQTALRNEAGAVVGDPLIVDGVASGRTEPRICSSGRAPGLYSWAGGELQFFCSANCPSGEDNVNEYGTFIGDQVRFIRPLSAATMSLSTQTPKAGRAFKVTVDVIQGTADFSASYPKAPVQLQLRQGTKWRDLKGLRKSSSSKGRATFKVVAESGNYLLRAVVEEDGSSLPANSSSKPLKLKVR